MVVVVSDAALGARWRDELERRGWKVFVASALKHAIDLVIKHRPSVIATQAPLPDATGFHYVRTLRGAVEHDVKVVAIAGTTRPPELHGAGFDIIVDEDVVFDLLHGALYTSDDRDARRPTSKIRVT